MRYINLRLTYLLTTDKQNMNSFGLQTTSLVQGIVGKQHERQVDYDKRHNPQQVHRASWPVADPGRAEPTRR